MKKGKLTIGTVCFLQDKENDRILFLNRSREPMKDMFTGVGGKTEFEEDINESCVREIKEETGLDACNLKLKGILKTILDGADSSWILFVYTSDDFSGKQIDCSEGELKWIHKDDIQNLNLIGFIREILPMVLSEDALIEGTIRHDGNGNVVEKNILTMA
ncbi:MAG: NUDIX domain-containing protein [Marinifilaceae bacterium]